MIFFNYLISISQIDKIASFSNMDINLKDSHKSYKKIDLYNWMK